MGERPASPGENEPGTPRGFWRRLAPKGGFKAQVLTLMSGTVAGQAILILSAPVLTRLYGPADFAVYALFAVATGVVTVIAAGRFDLALMLPEKDEDALNIVALATGLAVAVAALTLAVLAASHAWIARTFQLEEARQWYWLVAVGVVVLSSHAVGVKWHARKRRFGTIARAELAAAAGAVTCQIGAVFLFAQPAGILLVAGYLLGRLVGVSVLAWRTVGELAACRPQINTLRMRQLARRYRRFPLVAGPTSLLGALTQEAPKALLGALFGHQVLGYFALSKRVLQVPAAVVGKAVGQVFFPRIAEHRHDGARSRALILRSARALLLLIAGPMLVLFLFAEPLFALVFGAEWATAGTYARLLIPLLMMQFVVSPTALSLQAFEKQHVVLVWQALLLGVTVAAFMLGQRAGSAEAALLAYSLAGAVLYFVYLLLSLRYAGSADDDGPSGTPAGSVDEHARA